MKWRGGINDNLWEKYVVNIRVYTDTETAAGGADTLAGPEAVTSN
jgi:hypothetical protein